MKRKSFKTKISKSGKLLKVQNCQNVHSALALTIFFIQPGKITQMQYEKKIQNTFY